MDCRLCFTGTLFFIIALCSCNNANNQPPVFEVLDSKTTGLDFANNLHPTGNFNVFHYMYYYNGAGVAAGDFNNDGLTDLFFAANQSANTMYLNEGAMHFKDVSAEAQIPRDSAWSTGVSVIDINNDGLLDLYICRVGKYEILNSSNQFLICTGIDSNGIPSYADKAKEYGVDFSGFSTQAAFLDYDMDGDMDMYLLNHSIHQNGTFGPRQQLLAASSPLSGDRIYRNDTGRFTDVTAETGINSSVIGYGLGVVVADINMDGYPDLYIGNDFHENDYLYINQRNGTFKDERDTEIMHSSQFTMGVDAADINNDAYPDIITVDMLPADPYILKRSLGEDEYNIFWTKIKYGYDFQFTRNNLQLNRKNGMFSEVGLYSGVYATDWSWSPLWMDFDNDGLKDLFISNGIPKRLNDIDYVNYVSNEQVQGKIKSNSINEKDLALIDKFPVIKLPNAFFKNAGDAVFTDVQQLVKGNEKSFSNGAVYADLDNDGDLDIVTNNVDDKVLLYENTNNSTNHNAYLELQLKGPGTNSNAIGAKVIVYANGTIRTYEKYPARGFMSSMEIPVHIGLSGTKVDSMLLVWPDNTCQPVQMVRDTTLVISYKTGLPVFNYAGITTAIYAGKPMVDITKQTALIYRHEENAFNEFDREPLVPHMLSTEGPALAVADINNDGLEDVFTGSSKRGRSAVFIQQLNGTFMKSAQPALEKDSVYEDVDACFTDVNNDGTTDLIIAAGGNEYYNKDEYMQPRIYINDGKAHLIRLEHAFDSVYITASCVVPYDFNADGFMDVFIGARAVPWEYGKIPQSFLLQNDGKGHFKDVTATHAKELAAAGFVTQAVWCDMDKDGDKDLLLSLEWGSITCFINNKGFFIKKELSKNKGWWNFILPCDLDNDGDIDLIAGNLGLNSRLKASVKEPVRLYYNDFDDNGKKEQVLTYYLQGRELPFANKDELQRQIPFVKKKYLYAEDFAKASLEDIFTKEKLDHAELLTADYFSNAVFVNKGNMQFDVQALPWQAQLSSLKDAVITDANNDNLPDVLLAGNFYANNIEMGRYDADFGTVLINKGKAVFDAETINGLQIKRQARHIKPVTIAQQQAYIIAQNDDSLRIIKYKEK